MNETPWERMANAAGKTPAEVAAVDRFLASARELAVARANLNLAAHEAAGAMRNFADAWQANEERMTAEEARQIAEHPDLAEVNVYLDGFFA